MITRPLNVGDYIFRPNGDLGRIIRVNKQTYTFVNVSSNSGYTDNVPFNGKKNTYYYGATEWFECDEPTAKALEIAKRKLKVYSDYEEIKAEIKELLGKAKFFLKQIESIDEVEVDEKTD